MLIEYSRPAYADELAQVLLQQHERKKQEVKASLPAETPPSQVDVKVAGVAEEFRKGLEAVLQARRERNAELRHRAEMTVEQTNAALAEKVYPKRPKPILKKMGRKRTVKPSHVQFKEAIAESK